MIKIDESPKTLMHALTRNSQLYGKRIAIRERNYGIWQEQTWSDVYADVLAVAAALELHGVLPHQAVTVIGDNRSRLYVAMLAIGALRAFPSPVFPDVQPNELQQYTRFGKPDIAFAEDQEQVDKLLKLRATVGRPALIVYDDPLGITGYQAYGLIAYDQLLQEGRLRLNEQTGLALDLSTRAQSHDYAVLLHSSGTTGVAKGVPLTNANVVAGVTNSAAAKCFNFGEEHYAYLPIAWVGDFIFTLGAGVLLHFTINIPERQETVLHDLREVAPTVYLAPPRAWDNMLTRLQVGIAETTPFKRALYEYFIPRAISLERKRLKGGSATIIEQLVALVGEVMVYGPLKDFLGMSRVSNAYTGGEALGEDTFVLFRALGINLKQFYGQTETAAMSAAQSDGDVKLHTVGKPLPGVEMRISESGEILVRSGSSIGTYFDAPEESARAIVDGWLHTGDAGYLEPDGHLVVLGRVSEVVFTSGRERYIPNFMENRIKFSPYVRNVAVVGENRPQLAAIICIDLEAVGYWAEQRSISYTSYAELSQVSEVQTLIAGVLRHVNALLKPELRIHRFVNLHKDFDPDDGEVTRTRKLRRNVVEKLYAPLIEALYSNQESMTIDAKVVYESGEIGMIQRRLVLNNMD
jgi:long-chain acyl-CoA synthetase